MYSGVTVEDLQSAGTSDEAKAAVNDAAKIGASTWPNSPVRPSPGTSGPPGGKATA